jgi:hypothetical protein
MVWGWFGIPRREISADGSQYERIGERNADQEDHCVLQ